MGKAPLCLSKKKISAMQKILSSLDDKYPIYLTPEFEKLVNYSSQSDEPIHRWFRYREGYSTGLVKELLKEFSIGKLIIDPFCGAGTTLFTACNYGYSSIGIDANPLSVFVAKAKTWSYTSQHLDKFEISSNRFQNLKIDDKISKIPNFNIIEKVFLPDILQALLIIKNFIDTEFDGIEKDFFFFAWLSIIEKVSNVYREGNGIKYRNRKRTRSGYINIPVEVWQMSLFPENKFNYVLDIFLCRIQSMIEDVKKVKVITQPQVINGDALKLGSFVQPNSAGLIAFSPPYINNFNYFKAYKVELWMGGFISSYEEIRELTKKSLRSHVETQLIRDTDANNWYPKELDELINLIDVETLWTPRILQAIRGYFYDMNQVIQNIYQILETGGYCVFVVGNSAYGSILIPTDTLLAELARQTGFEVEKICVARHLTTSSQQKKALEPVKGYLRESLLFLKKK